MINSIKLQNHNQTIREDKFNLIKLMWHLRDIVWKGINREVFYSLVTNVIRNIQCEDISKLIQKAKEWESLRNQVVNLEASIRVDGVETINALQVGE